MGQGPNRPTPREAPERPIFKEELVGIPAEGLSLGQSPVVTITSTAGTRVAKLSDNASEPISVLRSFAADCDYCVRF